jgi:hypothetical protein
MRAGKLEGGSCAPRRVTSEERWKGGGVVVQSLSLL